MQKIYANINLLHLTITEREEFKVTRQNTLWLGMSQHLQRDGKFLQHFLQHS